MDQKYCSNCNSGDHNYGDCKIPITSYGVILIDVPDELKDKLTKHLLSISEIPFTNGVDCPDRESINIFCKYKDSIKFLMINRKHSLGFIEFMRGKYILEDAEGIILLFSQMTIEEIKMIKNNSFDSLWSELWGNGEFKQKFKREYIKSKCKFNKLNNCNNCTYLNLDFFVEKIRPIWKHTEWGFPKGRRNRRECNYDCAVREFKEESGFSDGEFIMFPDLDCIEESLVGTNNVNYNHVYYVGINSTSRVPFVDPSNKIQSDEIGNIMWISFDDAMEVIRIHHKDRKNIIANIFSHIMNFIIEQSRI